MNAEEILYSTRQTDDVESLFDWIKRTKGEHIKGLIVDRSIDGGSYDNVREMLKTDDWFRKRVEEIRSEV